MREIWISRQVKICLASGLGVTITGIPTLGGYGLAALAGLLAAGGCGAAAAPQDQRMK